MATASPQPTGHRFVRIGGLYDRRVNRSFETPPPIPLTEPHFGPLRRSTPHLVADDADDDDIDNGLGDNHMDGHRNGERIPFRSNRGATAVSQAGKDPTARNSATWCCGNFVLKQWRKMHNYD